MSKTVLDKTIEPIGESAHQASHTTTGVADEAIQEGFGVVKRAAKQGGDAAEEFLNDTTQRIQRQPALAVAVTFVVGFAGRALTGWTIRRR